MWNTRSGRHKKTIKGHTDAVRALAFSPDGKTLACGSWDKKIRLWDVATGEERNTLTDHSSAIFGVSFSLDGHLLASASLDGTILLWDMETLTKQVQK